MGSAPSSCNNLYSGTITSFLINNGSQTFDAVANPGLTFNVNTGSNYNTTFVIRAASESTFNNTNSGYTWYNTNAPAFWWGACVGSVGPNQNATVFEEWIDPHAKYEEFTQGVSFQSYNGNTVGYTVNWIPSSTSSSGTSTAPSAPQNLQAVSGNAQISLSWAAPSSNGGSVITNYNVYRSTSSGIETLLTTIGNVTSYTDNTVTNGQTYFYKVTAVNSVGESPQSNEASATPIATNTISMGSQVPFGIGVDQNTNLVYVGTSYAPASTGDNVYVVNGTTNAIVSTINGGNGHREVGVNPNTNMIYAVNYGYYDSSSRSVCGNTVSVIDGKTNNVLTIPVGNCPSSVGVNPNTNLVYVANSADKTVSVISGATNSVQNTIQVTNGTWSVGLNPNTNTIYVTNTVGNTISVIDGATNSIVGTITVGNTPASVAINPNTNMVYVVDQNSNAVSVINGTADNVVATIPVGKVPLAVGVNPNTNMVYVANSADKTVSVISGATNSVQSVISVGSNPVGLAVNPNTNTIYVTNNVDHTVSVINGGTASTSTSPSAPQNLAATVSTPSQINLNWISSSNNGGSAITGYMIERSTDGGTNWSTITSNTGTGDTTFSDTGLSPGATYTYRVSAINSAGSSQPSNVASATTPKMNLYPFWQTCCLGDLSVNGNVQNPIPGISQMRLLIHAPNGSLVFNQTESVGGFQSNYVISRSDGKGDYTITGTYDGMSQQKQITSMFNDPHPFVSVCECSSGIISYRGYVEGGLPGEKISTILKNSTNSTVASITQATDNHAQFMGGFGPFPKPENYTVIVTFLYNNSTAKAILAYSCQTSGCVTATTIPNPPSNLSATVASSSQINLFWTAPVSNGGSPVTGYLIQKSTDGGTNWSTIASNTGSTVTKYNDTGLSASTTYTYQVSAINSVGTSSPSNTASATTSGIAIASGIVLNNVQSTSGTTSSNQITLSGFNAGTGSNQLLLVGISANNNSPVSVTFNGVQLAQAVGSFYNNDAEFWYLKNPTGTGDIVVTMGGPTQAVVGAYSFSGVNQTAPIAIHVAKHNTTPNSPNISITTKYANDWVLDLPSIYGGSTLGSPTCTQQWDLNVPNAITGASSSTIVQSPATVTCKWTASSTDFWDDVAIELRVAG